jgi:hypothetical protein
MEAKSPTDGNQPLPRMETDHSPTQIFHHFGNRFPKHPENRHIFFVGGGKMSILKIILKLFSRELILENNLCVDICSGYPLISPLGTSLPVE